MDLWVVFITGLTIGGLTCLAVQGGLLASVITSREGEEVKNGINSKTLLPTISFLLTKLIAYTILGALLGAFGETLNINPTVQIIMQFIAGLYMITIALNLLNVHPIFRYAVIQPPRFLLKMVKNQSKSKDIFAPALLGAMTVFIPCGTTLAMEALVISSANPLIGAATMFIFILGTTPLFLGVGWLTTILGDNFRGKFLKLASFGVLYLGIASVNGALLAGGSPITLQSLAEKSPIEINLSGNASIQNKDSLVNATGVSGTQVANISVFANGYSPTYLRVKKDEPVKLNLITNNGLGCTSVFKIPQLGITKTLQKNKTDSIEFTPRKSGKIAFTCSMGMYSGIIEVI